MAATRTRSVLAWHVHGSWMESFASGHHRYLLPVTGARELSLGQLPDSSLNQLMSNNCCATATVNVLIGAPRCRRGVLAGPGRLADSGLGRFLGKPYDFFESMAF